MSEPAQQMDIIVPPSVGVAAIVMPAGMPIPITMFKHGVALQVPPDAVARLGADGWLLHTPEDLPILQQEIRQVAGTIPDAVDAFVVAITHDQHIDPAAEGELAVMQHAIMLLREKLIAVYNVAHAVYPTMQTGTPHTGVETRAEDGVEIPWAFDPADASPETNARREKAGLARIEQPA